MKTKVLIGSIQTALGCIGLLSGSTLNDMGYHFSDTSTYAFCGIMTAGFLASILKRQNGDTKLMRSFYSEKLSYTAIGLSFLMIMTGIGNRLHQGNQLVPMGHVVEKLDKFTFSQAGEHPTGDELNTSVNADNTQVVFKNNGGAKALLIIAYVLLAIILLAALLILTCAVWCIAIFSLFENPILGIVLILVAAAVTFFGVWLMIHVVKSMVKSFKKNFPRNTGSQPEIRGAE